MYFAPIGELKTAIQVQGCEISNCGKMGIYVASDKSGVLSDQHRFVGDHKCPYGVYSENAELSIVDTSFAQSARVPRWFIDRNCEPDECQC